MAVRLGLDMANAAIKFDRLKAAAAVRLLYTLAEDDKARLEVLGLAARIARLPSLDGSYPSDEAHWLVATAHNASCDAKSMRHKDQAFDYMEAAIAVAEATKCKVIDKSECLGRLRKWGCVPRGETPFPV
jgi:hypothetical protein